MSEGFRPARWSGSSGKKSVKAQHRPAPAEPTPAAAPEPDTEPTDAAKALAADNGIDLATLTGTGADGNVTVYDVRAAIEQRDQQATDEQLAVVAPPLPAIPE